MKRTILTGLGVLLLGASMAVAAPQSFRGNFNDQPAYQMQQQRQQPPQRQRNQRVSDRFSARSRRIQQQQHHKKHRKNRNGYSNWGG